MPLKNGYSQKTVHENVTILVGRDKKPYPQAWAIALEHARMCYFKAHKEGFLPPWLALINGKRDRASWEKERARK